MNKRKTSRQIADSADRGSRRVTSQRNSTSHRREPVSPTSSDGVGQHGEERRPAQRRGGAKTGSRKRSAPPSTKRTQGGMARKKSSSTAPTSPPAKERRAAQKRKNGTSKTAGPSRKTAGRSKPNRSGRISRTDGPAKTHPRVFEALELKRPVYGLGTFVAVAEAMGTTHDVQIARTEAFGASPGPGAAARKFSSKARLEELARVLAAFGSPHRLRILTALLYGPATYGTLQRASKLKAGPFYHHVNQLRLSGFLGPKTRDLYVLTRAGRNALLIALSLAPLMKDHRIRPMPEADDED